MLSNYNKWRIASEFFFKPNHEFYLREMSRISNIAPPSTKKYLLELIKEDIITTTIDHNITRYKAKKESTMYKHFKLMHTITTIRESHLITTIQESCFPNCIVLFGSCAKGEDDESSDIDLFVGSKHFSFDRKSFEKTLQRKINILWNESVRTNKELHSSLCNGIVLEGFLDEFKEGKHEQGSHKKHGVNG